MFGEPCKKVCFSEGSLPNITRQEMSRISIIKSFNKKGLVKFIMIKTIQKNSYIFTRLHYMLILTFNANTAVATAIG